MFERLKRRKLVQWALAYLAGAWLVLQVSDYVEEAFGWPPLVRQVLLAATLTGFLITLVLAWYHGERGRQRVGGTEVLLLALALALGGGVVWVVRVRALASAASRPASSSPPPERSIAVLPFRDLSAAGDQGWFADGIAEEILSQLSMLAGLRVVGRTSSFAFRGEDADVREIGRSLEVRTVLEGSVRRVGDTVRISVQLLETADGYNRWGEQFDRRLHDVLAVQEEIARAVADRLEVELAPEESRRLSVRETSSSEAYDLYLRGLQFQNRSVVPEDVRRASDYFRQAVALDSAFASAWVGLANTYVTMGNFRYMEPREAYGLADEYARRALELNEHLSGAHAAIGGVKLTRDFDPVAAEAEFRRAVALAPNDWRGYHGLTFSLQMQGRSDEALAAARREFDLDPFSYWPRMALEEIHYRRREYDEARRQAEAALEMAPGNALEVGFIGMVLAHQGVPDSAVVFADSALRMAPGDPTTELAAAVVHGLTGAPDRARRLLSSARGRAGQAYVSEGFVAAVYANLGEADSAFAALERARVAQDSWMGALDYPELDPIRDDPRFARLTERLGSPPDAYRSR